MPTEDYYDTNEYPEAYTTYDGREIWQFIHNKICFADSASDEWQYDFDRAVSGFHASVSAHIVQGMRDDELAGNVQDPNGLYPDAENTAMFQYKRRLRDYPGAVENLYFACVGTRRALARQRWGCPPRRSTRSRRGLDRGRRRAARARARGTPPRRPPAARGPRRRTGRPAAPPAPARRRRRRAGGPPLPSARPSCSRGRPAPPRWPRRRPDRQLPPEAGRTRAPVPPAAR